jgi:hypothetical protein
MSVVRVKRLAMRRPRLIEAFHGSTSSPRQNSQTSVAMLSRMAAADVPHNSNRDDCMAHKATGKVNRIDPTSSADVQKSSAATRAVISTIDAAAIQRYAVRHSTFFLCDRAGDRRHRRAVSNGSVLSDFRSSGGNSSPVPRWSLREPLHIHLIGWDALLIPQCVFAPSPRSPCLG